MKLGLTGPHRTGKTTLAQAISKQTGLPFLQTSTSQVFQQHGLDPAISLEFNTRLWIQQQVLTAATNIWQTSPAAFVTDRTPIDFMAYTLADIQGNTEVNVILLESYLASCFEAIQQFFTHLVVIQPAIPLVYEPGKAALNKAYLEHLNAIMLGLCHDERLRCPVKVLNRHIVTLEERVQEVLNG